MDDIKAGRRDGRTILVNNAGITRDNLLMRMKTAEWDDIIAANLSSVFHMSKACLRGMVKARFGRIVNIASVVGADGQSGPSELCRRQSGHDRLRKIAGA